MRLRIIIITIGAVVVGTVAAAFAAGGDSRPADPSSVVAAFYPLAYAAEQVGGAHIRVTNLTPAGVEPHDLELSPDDVATVKSAGTVLLMGHGFQPQLERAATDSNARVVTLLDTPGLGRVGNDPHVWLDPVRFATVAREIATALGTSTAADDLVARLDALDDEYRRGLGRCARREVVTSHAAFGYLAARYGLVQVPLVGLQPEAEPGPREVERLVDEVRATGATTVFSEPLASPALADAVAREAGVATAVLDPLEGLTADETDAGADYFSVMEKNLDVLRTALGCR